MLPRLKFAEEHLGSIWRANEPTWRDCALQVCRPSAINYHILQCTELCILDGMAPGSVTYRANYALPLL